MVPPCFRHLPQKKIALFAKERKEGAIFFVTSASVGEMPQEDAARSCCYFNFAISTSP